MEGFLVTMYIEIAFDWLDHNFLISTLEGVFFDCFSIRGLIYSYKIKAWYWRDDNLWLQLPLLCLCWWYNLFPKRYYFYKGYDWHFWFFSYFSGLKPNLRKSEIAGIRVLKGFQVAVCGMRCIDLNNGTLKLLGIHF